MAQCALQLHKASALLQQFHSADNPVHLSISGAFAKVCWNFNAIQYYGNTTAATIPIGMFEAQKRGLLKKGSLVASAAFGSGFAWGGALYRW